MEIGNMPPRRGNWAEKSWCRVAFMGHALMPNYFSSALIHQRLTEVGRDWPTEKQDPGFIRWFSFPVVPLNGAGQPVWVDFYVIPIMASAYMQCMPSGASYNWAERVALHAISEAREDGVEITVGWGALTKNATSHGDLFLQRHTELAALCNTTHGDAGTASLVMETLRQIGFTASLRVAVVGANGVIGDPVSQLLGTLNPDSICLVGKPDGRSTNGKNRDRLESLRQRSLNLSPHVNYVVSQNKHHALLEHHSDVVIVATNGMSLSPDEVPEGSLVLDMTTPAACEPDPNWEGRLVLISGCGQFASQVLPHGFGELGGKRLLDPGAGGKRVVWGCLGETIARAVFGRQGHLAGVNIPLDEVQWCTDHFPALGFTPQPPCSFGMEKEWQEVYNFICRPKPVKDKDSGAHRCAVVAHL